MAEIVFLLLGFAAAYVDLPVPSDLLLTGGRRERYHGTVVAAVATSLLLLALALAMAALSELIAMGRGAEAHSMGFRFRTAWLACVLVPWMCAFQLRGFPLLQIENRGSVVTRGAVILMAVGLPAEISGWPMQVRLLVFAGICLCGWAAFLWAARRVCLRGSLVAQSVRAGG
jgi:hypothetical protein